MISPFLADRLRALIQHWRNEAAIKDSFHATMGLGWKACADNLEDELEAALACGISPSPTQGIPGSEVLCEECAKVFCPHAERLHFHHDGCPACANGGGAPNITIIESLLANEDDEPDITIGRPWTDEQLADMRALALRGDLRNARTLLSEQIPKLIQQWRDDAHFNPGETAYGYAWGRGKSANELETLLKGSASGAREDVMLSSSQSTGTSHDQLVALIEQWRLIETAPTDGTRFLAANAYGIVRVSWWDDLHETWACFSEHAAPTQWMPLPPAPEQP